MTGKKILSITAVFIIIAVGLFMYASHIYGGISRSTERVVDAGKECAVEIDDIYIAVTAFAIGQEYFEEGGREYDLWCARRAYTKAIAIDKMADPMVWYQLGRVDFLEGRFRSAIYKFNKQIEYFGELIPNVHYMLGLTYGYKARNNADVEDWKKGEEAFLRFLELNPNDPWARVDLSWLFFAQGKYGEMKELLAEKLEFYQEHPWYLNMYGLALLNTGEREEAHRYFTRSFEAVETLTAEEWGASYPGNDPNSWPKGLSEMKQAIQHNVRISE